MKITRLRAEKVHGYLPFDIVFFPDLTFMTGLNGSGKTSALRLLMALLTPNLDEFALIDFEQAAVTVEEGDARIEILATKSSGELVLSVGDEKLNISSSELQLLSEMRRRDESTRNPVFEKVTSHKVFQRIKSLSTPMFLGIDRRHFGPSIFESDAYEIRSRQVMSHRMAASDGARERNSTSLVDVNYLVSTRMQAIRAAQEKLDEDLRKKFFTRAFEYKPAALTGLKGPSRDELESYKLLLQNIQSASEALQVPLPDIQASLSIFFDQMTNVVNLLETQNTPRVSQPSSAHRPKSKHWEKPPPVPVSTKDFQIQKTQVEWYINSPQADRILEHLKLLAQYVSDRKALREPVDRFLGLVNSFLKQTKKTVEVAAIGDLMVRLSDSKDDLRTIAALSSGERQLVVMLAHLSLNPNLAGSGVFIVDEPELSLHIDWQEKFVEAVRTANPSAQLILATHSPAIILDRVDVCVSLNK